MPRTANSGSARLITVEAIVADIAPLHDLVLIFDIDRLPQLFTPASVPTVIRNELLRSNTPPPVPGA